MGEKVHTLVETRLRLLGLRPNLKTSKSMYEVLRKVWARMKDIDMLKPNTATIKEIKKFLRLILTKLHPDKNRIADHGLQWFATSSLAFQAINDLYCETKGV